MKKDYLDTGFTLVELTVGMGIMVIILAGIISISSQLLNSYAYSREQGVNVQDAGSSLNLISQEIRNATSITAPTFTANSSTSGSKLNYQVIINSVAQNRSIYVDADSQTIFFNTGTTIKKLAVNRVDNLTFIRDGTNTRKVTIVLDVKNQSITKAPVLGFTNTVTTLNNLP
jgi:type II secretory pathway pseudopilin PulG